MLTRTRTIIICAAAAAAAGLAASIAAPAVATGRPGSSTVAGPAGAPRHTSNEHATGRVTTPANNRYFAGYETAVAAGSATTVSASYAVPALSCTTAHRAIAPDVGVLVNNYKTASIAGVIIACVNGTAVYYPSVVVNGTETDYTTSPVAAGDVIDLTTKVSTFRTRVQVTDVTTGVTQKITTGPGASASAAYIGDDALNTSSGALLYVPNFGKLQFKGCLIDGKALASWRPQAYQRVNSLGTVQISTGGIWSTEPAFTTRYMRS